MIPAKNQRNFPRFPMKNRSLTLIETDLIPCHIVDISQGGLSFRYLGQEQKNNQTSRLNIFFDQQPYLRGIPFKVVSDRMINNGPVPVRCRGVQFGELTEEQKNQLLLFIENFAEVQDSGSSLPN